MSRTRRSLSLLLAAALGFAGCSESGGGDGTSGGPVGSPACLDENACGGDPVGTWQLDEVCFPDGYPNYAEPDPQCPAATNVIIDYVASGQWDIRADGTYEADTTATTTQRLNLPLDCIGNSAEVCEVYGLAFGGECVVSGGFCQCTLEVSADLYETGAWQANGAAITLIPDGGEARTGEFCSAGGSLSLLGTEDQADTRVHALFTPL